MASQPSPAQPLPRQKKVSRCRTDDDGFGVLKPRHPRALCWLDVVPHRVQLQGSGGEGMRAGHRNQGSEWYAPHACSMRERKARPQATHLHRGPQQHSVADADRAAVQEHAVEVGIKPVILAVYGCVGGRGGGWVVGTREGGVTEQAPAAPRTALAGSPLAHVDLVAKVAVERGLDPRRRVCGSGTDSWRSQPKAAAAVHQPSLQLRLIRGNATQRAPSSKEASSWRSTVRGSATQRAPSSKEPSSWRSTARRPSTSSYSSVTLSLCSRRRHAMRSSVSSGSSALYGSPAQVAVKSVQQCRQPGGRCKWRSRWGSGCWAAHHKRRPHQRSTSGARAALLHTRQHAILVRLAALGRHAGAGLVVRGDHGGGACSRQGGGRRAAGGGGRAAATATEVWVAWASSHLAA